MNEQQLRHAIFRHLRAALILGWRGLDRLSRAARAMAQTLRTRLILLRVANGWPA